MRKLRRELPPGTEAVWDRDLSRATCLVCADGRDPSIAGGSAEAEGERRVARRVRYVKAQHGAAAAAVAEQVAGREMEASWFKGSKGESSLAAYVAAEP